MKWQPIETAPRDGTEIVLTWMENGNPQEVYPHMVWNQFAGNKSVQDGKGIWALHGRSGAILRTWSEANGDGPTHWMAMKSWYNQG